MRGPDEREGPSEESWTYNTNVGWTRSLRKADSHTIIGIGACCISIDPRFKARNENWRNKQIVRSTYPVPVVDLETKPILFPLASRTSIPGGGLQRKGAISCHSHEGIRTAHGGMLDGLGSRATQRFRVNKRQNFTRIGCSPITRVGLKNFLGFKSGKPTCRRAALVVTFESARLENWTLGLESRGRATATCRMQTRAKKTCIIPRMWRRAVVRGKDN